MTRTSPADLYSTLGTGSGSGSAVCAVSGVPDFSAAASAAASSGIVLLQLQSLSVLCSIAIVFFCFSSFFFLFLFLRGEERPARMLERGEQLFADRFGLGVVVDVGVEPVHHVEARIGEELLQRRALHRLLDLGVHERLEIGFEVEAV